MIRNTFITALLLAGACLAPTRGLSNDRILVMDSVKSLPKRCAVKFFLEPQYSYRLTNKERHSFVTGHPGDYSKSYNYNSKSENGILTLEAGVELEIRLDRLFSLNTGLGYEKQGYRTEQIDVVYFSTNDVSWFSTNDTLYNFPSISYEYHFVTLPVMFGLTKIFSDYSFGLLIGAELQYLFSYKCGTEDGLRNGAEPYHLGFRGHLSFDPTARVTIAYKVAKKLWIYAEPDFSCKPFSDLRPHENKHSYNMVQGMDVKLWSAGCRLGIKF
jgi:hypothetical protein